MKQLSFLLAALLLVGLVSAADAVCPAGQVLDQRNITGTITFSLVKNTGNGNMVPLVYANGNRELFNGSQSFPLFVDGARVTDAHFSPNSVGVVLHRKSTGLSLTFKGSHTRGSELVIANLSLSGATFGKFTNSKDGNYKMENPRNGVINPLHSNDEVIDITPSLLTIYSGTSTGNDRFFVKVVPSCHVPPPPACSDGVDTDHDGFTDLADFGCMGADDIDETNNGNTQCSDGIDNDADGTFDEEDSQCSNAADNTETFPTSSHLCPAGQLLVTPNISMSVVFDYLKNTGAGNLDNQVFYNNGRSTAASGQPILLATDGVFVEDTLTGLNKPGIVLRRSVRNLLVHFQGSNPHGSESVQATMTLSGATFGAFKNAASELNRMETPRNGIATFTGDDEVTTVAPNQIRVVSTTSTANDRFYIEVVPSCQIVSACNDGVDNDRDGYTDLADFGCVNAADTSEVNNGATQCSDGLDNDADGRIDQADSDCTGPTDAYETFLCVQDNDCTLGANGPLICTGDNVTQTQGPATCVNAGTPQAFCRIDGITAVVQQCANGCFQGVCTTVPACSDMRDNDNDGLVDYPLDPGCTSATDTDETDPVPPPACFDGFDNDNDTRTDYPSDSGCASASDTDETDPIPACADLVDNDNDGFNNLADFGCTDANDNDETNNGITQCSDGLDNDGDNRVDQADPDCAGPTDAYETFLCVQDNDCTLGANGPLICTGDNVTQTQGPATCVNAGTPQAFCRIDGITAVVQQCPNGCFQGACNAFPACSDGVDNDRDGGFVDLNDFGCIDANDNDETNNGNTQCSDGLDNDGDGKVDQADSDCTTRTDDSEGPVACISDADCPNGLIGGLSCRNDNVMQLLVKSACHHAGTTSSMCQTTFQESVIVQRCDEQCSLGACVSRAKQAQTYNDDLYLPSIRIGRYTPGDRQMPITIRMENRGDVDLDGVRVVASIRELDVFQPLGRVDVDNGDTVTVRGAIDLPVTLAPGEYTLGVSVGNEDVHRNVYRVIRIR